MVFAPDFTAHVPLVEHVAGRVRPLVAAGFKRHKMPASSIRFSAERALLPNVRLAIRYFRWEE